jgi:hypothetical protein
MMGSLTYFAEADLAVPVLIHFSNHRFQAQMGLWGLQLLHHPLQLPQIQEPVLTFVKPATQDSLG